MALVKLSGSSNKQTKRHEHGTGTEWKESQWVTGWEGGIAG